jgi:hypothetical protein
VLQAVVGDDDIDAVLDEHVGRAQSIRIDDDGTAAALRKQYRFVTDHAGIAVGLHAHRRPGMRAPVSATHNAGTESALP